MKKAIPIGILFLLLFFLLIFTNPTEKDFDDYIKERSVRIEYAGDSLDATNQQVAAQIKESKEFKDNGLYTIVTAKYRSLNYDKVKYEDRQIRFIGILGTWYTSTKIFNSERKKQK